MIEEPKEDTGPEEAIPGPEDDKDTVKPAPGFGGFPNLQDREGEPRRRGRPPGSKNKPKSGTTSTARPSATNLKKSLRDTITLIGVGVSVANKYDGAVILKGAEGLANSLDHLAQENPAVKRALESALTASAWGAVITSGAAIAIPIAANHRLAPPGLAPLFGCPPPDYVGLSVVE